MTNFINTTPHTINLKCSDGIYEIKQTNNKDIVSLFRGNTVNQTKPVLNTPCGNINITGVPVYNIDENEFYKLVTDQEEKTVYLISTISGEMLKKSSIVFPKNVFYMVPYSGPDQEKCCRQNGQIKWVAELMDYTN